MSSIFKTLEQMTGGSSTIAIVPLGATEFHGPHLPNTVDWLIAQGICERLNSEWDKERKANSSLPELHLLEVEKIGYSPENMRIDYPFGEDGSQTLSRVGKLKPKLLTDGEQVNPTTSLTFDDAIKRWVAFGKQLHGRGYRKVVFLNAHGGNSPLLKIVVQELRIQCGDLLAVETKWDRFLTDDMRKGDTDIHGGKIETAVMMALGHGDKIKQEKAEHFEITNPRLHGFQTHSIGWRMRDLNGAGAVGNAADANKKDGEGILSVAVSGLVELLEEVQGTPTPEPLKLVTGKSGQGKARRALAALRSPPSIWLLLPALVHGGLLTANYFNWPMEVISIPPLVAAVSVLALVWAVVGLALNRVGPLITILALIWHTACSIAVFAYLYLANSGNISGHGEKISEIWDALYFSIVTWTTLGYGDFQPKGIVRLLASVQALTGYVVLGTIVGAVSALIGRKEDD